MSKLNDTIRDYLLNSGLTTSNAARADAVENILTAHDMQAAIDAAYARGDMVEAARLQNEQAALVK